MTEPRSPAPTPVPARVLPGPKPGFVPGQKRARHQRWTRVTAIVTVAGGVLLLGAGAIVLPKLLDKPTLEESRVGGVRDFLAGVARQVEIFASARNRLPTDLAELRDPDLPSVYDAEPWDVWRKPIAYRVVDGAARTFRLRSSGPDGAPDTADDVVWPPGTTWK